MTLKLALISAEIDTSIRRGPPLDNEPESKDEMSRDRLVEKHLPLVRRLCKRFSNSGELMEDLVQVGSIGLLKAVKKYDPDRLVPFNAYAIPVILGEIKNYFRDHGWAVKVPRKLQRQKLAVGKAVEAMTQVLGRSPTMAEIAVATGLSQEDVLDTLELDSRGRPLSLDARIEAGHGEDGASLLDYLGDEDPQMTGLSDTMDLANALQCLTERKRLIIRWKFYTEVSQSRIAGYLGISQMHVSRLQRNALRKLRVQLAQ